MSNVLDFALSQSIPALQYPRWFLLKWNGIIPFTILTMDVGNYAFECMLCYGRFMVVPPGADIASESMHRLFILVPTRASVMISLLWDICDP
jgi:hypothetical protein